MVDLRMTLAHARDDQEFDLTFEQRDGYGFRREAAEAAGEASRPGEEHGV